MILKIRSLAFMLLLIMLFSGVVSGGNYDNAATPLLDAIALAEGTDDLMARNMGYDSGYDVLIDYQKPKDFDANYPDSLTEMTLAQVKDLQGKMSSTAVGRYQFLYSTLWGKTVDGVYHPGLVSKNGLSLDTKFDAKIQDLFGLALLEGRHYSNWIEGTITDDQFQLNLAQEWSSIPDPSTGKSYYGGNVDETTDAEIKAAMVQTISLLSIPKGADINPPISESNIVGEWSLNFDWSCSGSPYKTVLNLYSDGTLDIPEFSHVCLEGKWEQSGDTIRMQWYATDTNENHIYEGTIDTSNMDGEMSNNKGQTGCWSAYKRYTDPGVMV